RNPGPNGSYTLVYTFDRPISSAGNASATQGTATAATPTMGPQPNQITVNLTGVTSPQHLVVRLSNAHDTSDAVLGAIDARMDVLIGDTTADGVVNSADIAQTKSQSGQTVSQSNFRTDVTADGNINSADIALAWLGQTGSGFTLSKRDVRAVNIAVSSDVGPEVRLAHRLAGLRFGLSDIGRID